jgi:hypothetical protein
MSRTLAVASALLIVGASWSVSAQPASAGAQNPAKSTVPRQPGPKSNVLTVIQGNAVNSSNAPMGETLVRLRDARFGRVVETRATDKAGRFAFNVLDPGSYVVEILGTDQTLLAASQILNVNAGDMISAIVKLPLSVTPFAGILNSSIAPSAAMMATQAAANGIVAVVPTAPVSPNQ